MLIKKNAWSFLNDLKEQKQEIDFAHLPLETEK